MKKDSLYEIYSILKYDTQLITDSLYKLMSLNNNSERLFIDFCKGNVVFDYTFDLFLNISNLLGDFSSVYNQDELKKNNKGLV